MLNFKEAIEKLDTIDPEPERRRKVYVVTTDAPPSVIKGWLDMPATETERELAASVAGALAAAGVQAIVCSDMSRTNEMAKMIGEATGVQPVPTDKLRPWDVGDMAGLKPDPA